MDFPPITFDPPLPCVACGKPATVASVTMLPHHIPGADQPGGYLVQPLCRACVDRTNALYNAPEPPGDLQ